MWKVDIAILNGSAECFGDRQQRYEATDRSEVWRTAWGGAVWLFRSPSIPLEKESNWSDPAKTPEIAKVWFCWRLWRLRGLPGNVWWLGLELRRVWQWGEAAWRVRQRAATMLHQITFKFLRWLGCQNRLERFQFLEVWSLIPSAAFPGDRHHNGRETGCRGPRGSRPSDGVFWVPSSAWRRLQTSSVFNEAAKISDKN